MASLRILVREWDASLRDLRLIRTLVVCITALLGLGALLTGCGSPTGPEHDPLPSGPTTAYFDGTPEEYTTLLRACLAEAGIETVDGTTADGYLVSTEVANSKEYTDASEACSTELGEIQVEGLSENQLRQRYDARAAQFECLVENALISGEPMSFEVFVDGYNRSGQRDLWEPTQGASSLPGQGPSEVCPRTTSW